MVSRVTSTRVPYLPIVIEIPERQVTLDSEALVDTGSNGEVIVPPDLVGDGPVPLLYNDIRLADDSRLTVPVFLGNLRIGDTMIGPVMIFVMGSEPVIGLSIITQFASPSTTTAH